MLYSYIEKLKNDGRAQSYINYLVRGPIGTIFRMQGLRVPVKLPRFTGPSLDLEDKVSYTNEEVMKLIKAVKESKNPVWQFLMATSTTWGLREGEIRRIVKSDISASIITMHTEKGGETRKHTIPDAVKPYISGYKFPFLSETGIFAIFHQIEKAAGITPMPRKAFHAIRHALVTQLIISGVHERVAYQYTGWKLGGILGVYFKPKPADLENEIYPKHPFLKCWGKK